MHDQRTGQPVANADVAVRLQPKGGGAAQTLYSGKTDARGTAPVAFTIPPNTTRDQTLVVETSSGAGRDHIEKAIVVQRNYKLLITTDKPLYQPGQTIHLRALALGALDRAPAKDQPLEFLIEDPKGNKIYRKTVQTSAYGITSADFQFADTLNAGAYKITASIGDAGGVHPTKSEKAVTVKPYVLPKFKVSVETDRGYYLPGERVTGRVRADYFFGKPVAKSDVPLKGVVYDVARAETVNLTGKTDANGVYAFSFTLPNYFAGRGLDKNRADFGLEVSVNDLANHTEHTSLVLPIASDAIMIDAVPESGKLIVGVENLIYVLTSLPDGSPVESELTIGNIGRVRTGKYGLAEIKLIPQRGNNTLTINARDAQGRSATRAVTLQSETTAAQILLRPDRATYRVGDTMRLEMLTSGGVGTVYLDIIKEGQTFSTRALDVLSGRASADIDVTPELIGTTQLHAYHVERDGTIVRDTRVIVVEQLNSLQVAIKADRDTYRPGENSRVTFNVTNSEGKGVPSALGVTAVDESVFALAEQDPGFAKLYFLLQKELLDPKFQVKGFETKEIVAPTSPKPQDLRAAQDQATSAAWAGATPFDFVLRANSQPEKVTAANKAQAEAFNNLAVSLALLLAAIPLALGGFVLAGLRANKVLGRSLAIWLGAALAYCIVTPFMAAMIAVSGALLMQVNLTLILIALIALAWLVGFGILAVYAVVRRAAWLQVSLLLLVAYVVFFGLLLYAGGRAANFGEWALSAVVIGYLVGVGALVLMGVGLLVQKEIAPGFAALVLAVLFIPATILLAALPSGGPFQRMMSGPTSNVFRDVQRGLVGGALSIPPPMPVPPTAAPAATTAPKAVEETAPGQAAPRVREYFPETLYNNPQVITDENGRAALDIPLADSITTWRLAAMASSQRGELGASSAGLRVFQDFFVDLDLPAALTQNDEISVPVAVYNYLPAAQQVKLQIEKQPWFTLQGDAEKTLKIASNDITVVYFRIKATTFGMQKLKITALGEKPALSGVEGMSDAIQREIRVYPDGKQIEATQSNWLKSDTQQVVEIPAPAIPGASRIEVKIYPGIMSQAINGLEGLLKVPYG
ncbi:MAG: hypothetical protein HY782_22060 [Chloroflexi bacterium]|nr:hypothetical protein [Chloroflexota bacterium]